MRSLLIQASSVEKAVEKAWASAGMPTEFNIKILDFGEKGFLGITKKQAIISIIYEPQKQTSISTKQSSRVHKQSKKTAKKPKPQRKQQYENRQQQQGKKDFSQNTKKNPKQPQVKQKFKSAPEKPVAKKATPSATNPIKGKSPSMKEKNGSPAVNIWTDPMIDEVTSWLKKLATSIKIPTTFKAQVNKKALKINFDGNVAETKEGERHLFSSLSFLLLQFMKKKHKKKYPGYQIILTSSKTTKD